MPLDRYGVLKAHALTRRISAPGQSHYQLLLSTGQEVLYRAAINVRSKLYPSPVEYHVARQMKHPLCAELSRLPMGFHDLPCASGGQAVDYIRSNLFDRDDFLTLPCDGPECRADLNAVLDDLFLPAIDDPDACVYVYGEPWEALQASDPVFRFRPSRGMHEVHMNQGNDPSHWEQDGVWQDGAVLVEHRRQRFWQGIFIKFQSQSWHTDDASGHAIAPPASFDPAHRTPLDRDGRPHPDGMLRIVTATVDPLSVTLLNVCPFTVNLSGWSLINREGMRWKLKGELPAGERLLLQPGRILALNPGGGLLTLLDHNGLKVDGVSYTGEEYAQGRMTFFMTILSAPFPPPPR